MTAASAPTVPSEAASTAKGPQTTSVSRERVFRVCADISVVLGYWVVSAGTLGLQYAFGAIYPDLLDSLGGSRAATALIGSICVGVMDLAAVAVGPLLTIFGERCICAIGGLFAGAGLLLSSIGTRAEHLYVPYGLLLGIGHSMSLYAGVVSINQCFVAGRSRAQAFGNTGSGAVTLVIGSWYRDLSQLLGWRGAFRVLAACDAFLLCTTAFTLRRPPARDVDSKLPSDGSQSVLKLLCNARLQVLCVAIVFFGLGGWSVMPIHLVRLALDVGCSENQADALVSAFAIGSIVLRLPIAALADHLGRCAVFASCACVYAVSLVIIAAGAETYAVLVACTVLVGGMVGSMLSVMVTLPPEAVAAPDIPKATTLVSSCFGLGSLCGPMIAGAIFDATGSYTPALFGAATCLLISALSFIVRECFLRITLRT